MKLKNIVYKTVAVLLALFAWQAAAYFTNLPILLPSPIDVIKGFGAIFDDSQFSLTIISSFSNIALGFIWGFLFGMFFAILAGRFQIARELLWPYMITIKSVPVASFIIIALLWISTEDLSRFISFLMVFPVVYNNILEGYKSIDVNKLELATVYNFNFFKQLIYIYLPGMKPFIISACSTSFGLAWKSGVAAEFIGLPDNSIGEKLYYSKVYLESVDLFAWTIMLIIISFAFEKLIVGMIKLAYKGVEKL